MIGTAERQQVAGTLRVLSHPVRLEIMRLAAAGDVSVGSLADELEISQPVTSQHLRVLREHGVLTVRKDGQRRLYSVRGDPLEQLRSALDEIWPAGLAQLKRAAEAKSGAAVR